MNAFINEFHYDNDGADVGEFIEVAGPAGTDLTGWTIVLYNGNGGAVYDTIMLSGEIPNLSNGFGALSFPRAGIQNGAPDGFALVDDAGAVVEFLSYEGTFTAVGGPAGGMTSVDVGVSEAGNSPVGFSLQRAGTGTEAADFAFQPSQAETPGAVNTGQTFTAPGSFDLQITEIWPGNEPGANLTEDWFEVTNFGTAAWTIADGALFFDDESAAAGDADMLMGVTEIAPGESVVFVDDASAQEFIDLWGAVIELGQVGTYAGAGLGQGGDAVALFLDDEGDGVDAGDLIDLEAYPNAEAAGGASYEVTLGAFSADGGVGDGVVTTAVNDAGQPAIGSPTNGAEIIRVIPESAFTLEILHVTDQEASSAAVFDAPRLSAVMNALEAQDLGNDGIADNTLRLSSGDAILPGLFFQASAAVFGVAGLADMIIQNELGFDAIAFGNHEFDFGSGFIADLIDGTFDLDGDPATAETPANYSFEGVPDFMGTDFPYLSSNLDFSTEPSLAPLEVPGGGAPMPNTVTSSVVLETGGELIGVVGATTPTIDFISSPGLLGVLPEDFDSAPTPEQIDALAAIIQAEVDALLAANPTMNKVILLAHMQQIAIEQELAKRLVDVDIIVAGGSNTRLLDETDRLRDGDTAQGVYPLVETNAGGTQTLIVNTDGSYKYVGRLVIDFDAEGNIIAESYDAEISGAYATDDAGVALLGAEGLIDPEIQAVADLIGAEIARTEGNVFGVSDVYLAGLRPEVRQEETNLGNLTADANLFEAKKTDASVLVSIKNGGGIRDDIGQIVVPAGGTEAVRIPNEEILDGEGNVIKPEGGISQNDIIGALRFNNSLTIVTLTAEELRAVLEHGVAASTYDENGGLNQQGRFPQVAGVNFSFDPDLPGGARIVNAAILGDDGEVLIELVRDGETVSPDTPIRVVTLGFLADGGDGYPFPEGGGADRVDLSDAGTTTGDATFAEDGTEQDAFAEFLLANFLETPFAEADTPLSEDTRIQNLNFRADAVFGEVIEGPQIVISEIMYNPASAEDDWEWVEIVNLGDEAVDLAGWVIDDGNNTFHAAANIAAGVIEAGGSAVLFNADDVSAEDFAAAWGGGLNLVAITNWSALALNNGGDIVGLWSSFAEYQGDETTFANVIDVVDYNPIGNLDDGAGSIFLTDLAADNNDTSNWALSTAGGETPVGTGRLSEAEGGNSGSDVGSPGGDPVVLPDGAPDPLNELSIALAGTITLGGAEIVDFDAATGRAFVTSGGGLIVVDASDLTNLTVETTLAATDFGFATDDVTSVSVRNGVVAVSLPAAVVTDNGQVLFFDAATLELLGSVDVGPLPDAVKFNAAGTHLVVSNEGQSAGSDNEPDVLPNPEGSVFIVALNLADLSAPTVTTLGFTDASITAEALEAKGVRINPNAPSAAADIEPEFATIVGNTAYIALQENNAVAVIEDITNPAAFTIDSILPLGLKDHSVVNQGLDASNQDGAINIANYDIFGLFQPDGMDSYEVGGVRYFLTANEGDTREVDEARGAQLVDGDLSNGEVDADIGAELLAQLADNAQLGRLLFSTVDGDTDGDGDIDVLHSFGARSFSIFDENGNLVFDSGDDFEQITAVQVPGNFNGNQNASSFDSRSDDKGPEPEAVVLGEIDGKTYAFIGLERVGGVMVYDVTNPAAPVFEQYLQTPGDFGPEGLRFITADESPTGNPVLAISSEVSNTLSFYEINLEEEEITLISAIQGSSAGVTQVGVDDRAALEEQIVTIEAIVTADFQGSTGLNGFFVQEEDADQDGDATTSEGLFIFDGALEGLDVNVGDLVRVTGTVQEFFGQTQIGASAIEIIASNQMLPTTTVVTLGSTGAILDASGGFVVNLEAVEGMLVTFENALTIAEMFNLDRFGEYRVSSDGRPEQFTQSNAPSVEGFTAHLADVAARTVVLDDGSGVQNPLALEIIDGNNGVLDAEDSFRMGDQLTDVTGVVAYGFNEFRLNDATGTYTQANPRPETPEDVGGNFKVASLNVLNYFTTIDTGVANSGPNDTLGARGADSVAEFERQAAKTVQAIIEADADVLGLVELENDDDIAIADLVSRVNAALGSEVYDFIATGDVGADAITTGIIYKTASVEPLGGVAILTEFNGESFVDPLGAGSQQNRPAVAQTFTHLATGETMTVAVNHLKSMGSSTGAPEDADQLDGQGASNATRTAAAEILADWLASDPTGTGAVNQLILGDLNAYAQEDPIKALEAAGFTDIAGALLGDDAYSFVFDGQIGTLDYVLANGPAFEKVSGATEWHINADEADAIDYNLDFGRDPALFNGETAARNSDHDPVIVGFDLQPVDDRPFIFGTEGDDRLVAGPDGAIIDGGAGRDTFVAGAGADTFILEAGVREHVRRFDASMDKLDISAWGAEDFDELVIFDRPGGPNNSGLLITIMHAESRNFAYHFEFGDRLSAEDFTAENFIFADPLIA